MTFETIRLILIFVVSATERDISDYRCIFYTMNPDIIFKKVLYREIPDCFNCKVKAFEIDLDTEIMYIKSEVDKHE